MQPSVNPVKLGRKNSPLKLALRKGRAPRAGAATKSPPPSELPSVTSSLNSSINDTIYDDDPDDRPSVFLKRGTEDLEKPGGSMVPNHKAGNVGIDSKPLLSSSKFDVEKGHTELSVKRTAHSLLVETTEEPPSTVATFWDDGEPPEARQVREFAALISATTAFEREPPPH
eukprot:CAMPEP_0171686634 /NCGR_PEP_ID=MMETSP0991-20121206/2909_1 /TAXON_ID=483369 /ORGANISM="non described non described, Strain CCMP2098" /LENGTH=170 /DNA_ID=CAMNT_0012274407 /DNA_START=52 /DNA_END=561 /DNA_ORIENTATION=+